MLIPLNNSTPILPTSYCSKAGIRSIAEQYLSTSKTYALVTKSVDDKYHLVTTHDRSFHGLKTALKVVSYCTVLLPLIAKLIKLSIKDNRSTNKYYTDCYFAYNNFYMFRSADIHELAALHKLHPNLLTQGYPFAEACLQNNKDLITNLFNLGGKELLQQTNYRGNTPFTQACINQDKDLVSHLFNLGGKELLQEKNHKGNTPFIEACINKNKDLITHLFNLGGKELLQQKNHKGNTPFVEACINKNKDLITHLFNLGGKELLNQTDKEGDTPFTDACLQCSYTMISFIFNLGGIDLLRQVNTRNNRTVLVDAVKEDRSWYEISNINHATSTYLFQTVSDPDLFKIKATNLYIYNKIITDPSFRLNPNYSKHTPSHSSDYSSNSSKSSDSKNFHVSQATFEDALKVLFDGKELVKTKKAITKAYKLACAKHHPDKNIGHEKEAHAKFLAIQAAHQQIQNSYSWNSLPQE